MEIKQRNFSRKGSEQLFPALLFFIFLLCTLFTILIGSRVYENIRERNNSSFHTDTALAYITNKVRQNDQQNTLSIRNSDSTQILVLSSEYDGLIFETWIYQMDGTLWELFAEKDSGLDIYSGQMIMDCGTLSFDIQGTSTKETLLTISLEGSQDVKILLRTSQEGGFA